MSHYTRLRNFKNAPKCLASSPHFVKILLYTMDTIMHVEQPLGPGQDLLPHRLSVRVAQGGYVLNSVQIRTREVLG